MFFTIGVEAATRKGDLPRSDSGLLSLAAILVIIILAGYIWIKIINRKK